MQLYRQNYDELLEVEQSKLIEYTEYILDLDADSVYFLGCELVKEKKSGWWKLRTPFAVGKANLTWIKEKKQYSESVVIKPHPDKIEERDIWQKMLEDLLEWSTSLLGHQGVRDASVQQGDLFHYLMLEALYPLLAKFKQSLAHLFENLREKVITPELPLNLLELRAPFPLQQLASNPSAMAWLRGKDSQSQIPIVEAPFVTQTYNHPVNRYIRWLVEQVIQRLEMAVKHLRDIPKKTKEKEKSWRIVRSNLLEEEAKALRKLLFTSPLREISPQPLVDSAFLVILNDPLYATVHRYGRLLCHQGLSIDGGDYASSMNRSFDIYELWCFQEVVRQFERFLKIKPEYTNTNKHDDNPQWGTTAIFRFGEEEIRVEYNATFPMLFPKTEGKDKAQARHSLITTQRPDVVIFYQNHDSGWASWLALDAKYRTSQKNLSDAFSSAFAYRQSLIDPKHNGFPAGCYLLVPKILDETKYWFDLDFAKRYSFGAFLCRPKETNADQIVTFILEQLGRVDN